jgi:hypothetical protein
MSSVLFSSSSNPGLAHLTAKLSTIVEKPTALEVGSQKVGSKIWILGRIRTFCPCFV